MKKIFAIWCIGCLLGEMALADCDWIEWDPRHDPYDNEYIWKTAREYNDVIKGVKDGTSKAAVCGSRGSKGMCRPGETINAPADHVFKADTVRAAVKYECTGSGMFGFAWKPIEGGKVGDTCSEFRFEGTTVKPALKVGQKFPSDVNGTTQVTREECAKITGESLTGEGIYQIVCGKDLKLKCELVKKDSQDDTCSVKIKGQNVTIKRGAEYNVDLTSEECKSAIPSAHGATYDTNAVYHFYCGPICKNVGCKKGYGKDTTGKCVKNNPNPPKQKSCREKNKNAGANRLACCDVEASDTGSWVNGECKCKNKDAKFKVIDTDHGICMAGDGSVVPPVNNCPDDAYPDGGTCMCNNPDMTYNKAKNLCECPGDTNKVSNECRCEEKNKVLKNGQCEWSDEYLASLKMDIETWYSKINGLTASFEVNKWKDAEGNFNTARLASDSIAGVVLGTVGGVVTARLVKKSQIKKGFEDIQCHIGGQPVADYGDEFTVGR